MTSFGVPGQGLVDRVVHDLEDHVVQAGAVVHIADIHARTLAHGFQTTQDGDLAGVVGLGGGDGSRDVRGIVFDLGHEVQQAPAARGQALGPGIAPRHMKIRVWSIAGASGFRGP
jgi:hypothetical protein